MSHDYQELARHFHWSHLDECAQVRPNSSLLPMKAVSSLNMYYSSAQASKTAH